jgi:hypothetical protein
MDVSTSEVAWNEWFSGYFETQNRQSKWVIGKIVIPKGLWLASSKKETPARAGVYLFLICIQYSGWNGTHGTGVWSLFDAGFR